MRRHLTSALLSLCLVGTVGCNKSEQQQSSSTSQSQAPAVVVAGERIMNVELLKYVPAAATAFVVWDFQGPAYQKLRVTPWAISMSMGESVKTLLKQLEESGSTKEVNEIKPILEALQKLGILGPEGHSQIDTLVSQAVWYIDVKGPKKLPESTLVVSGGSQGNLNEKLPALQELLKQKGLVPNPETYGGATGFSVNIKLPEGSEQKDFTIYAAATDKKLAVGLDKATVEGMFKPAAQDNLAALKGSPEFKRAVESVGSGEETVALAYVGVSKLLPIIEEASKSAQPAGSPNNVDVSKLPVESLVWKQTVNEGFTNRWAVTVSPKTEAQTKIFKALEDTSAPVVAAKLPANTAMMLAIDTRPLKRLEFLMNDVADPSAKAAYAQAAQLNGATLAIRNSNAGSPLPDILLFIDAENPMMLAELVKGGVGQAMGGAPGQWQEMDVDGLKATYLATPLGVGLYMAQPTDGKSLVVASSPNGLKDALSAIAGKGDSLATKSSTEVKARLGANRDVVLTYFNFTELANVIESVKSSIAMFTGGTQEFDKFVNPTEIRKMGISVGGISFRNNTFEMLGRMEPPAVVPVG